MRISDWSSDVCSSDLLFGIALRQPLMGGTAFRTGSSLCPQERDLLAVEEIVHIHVASPSTCQGYGKMRLFSHCPRVEFRSKSAQCAPYTIFLSGCGPIFGQNRSEESRVGQEWFNT